MATKWTDLVAKIKFGLSVTGTCALGGTERAEGLGTVTHDLSWPTSAPAFLSPSFGSGSGQINEAWADQRTLAADANEELDLAGALVNGQGQVVTFATVKAILIHVVSTGVAAAIVGPGTAPFAGPWAGTTPTTRITVGNVAMWTNMGAGWTVTATSNDQLKILAGATDVLTYDIVILGVSA